MSPNRKNKANAIVILFMATGLFLVGCRSGQQIGPTITPIPSNCPKDSITANLQASSTMVKVGEKFIITASANWPIGPVYSLAIEDIGIDRNHIDKNAVTEYSFPEGITVRIISQKISKEINLPDLEMLDIVKGFRVVLQAEQAGSFTVTFNINGESSNDCAGYPIYNYRVLNANPLTITVIEP